MVENNMENLRINCIKEFIAGFFTSLFITSIIILIFLGGFFKCGFRCLPTESQNQLSMYAVKALILAISVSILYILWKEFDETIVAFPLIVFKRFFYGQINIKQTFKILISLYAGYFLGIWATVYIFTVYYIGFTSESSIISSYGLGSVYQTPFDAVYSYLINELRGMAMVSIENARIGVAVPYLLLTIMFALFYERNIRDSTKNALVIGVFTFLIYSISGDLFVNSYSFVLAFMTKSADYRDYFFMAFFDNNEEIRRQAFKDLMGIITDDFKNLISTGLLYLLISVCGLFIGIFMRKELFELDRRTEEAQINKVIKTQKKKRKG
ncbi:MAG: hypothetical protein QXO21_05495 [Candidatus Anstonellales archaeon]